MRIRPALITAVVLLSVGVVMGVISIVGAFTPAAEGCPTILDPPADAPCIYAQVERRAELVVMLLIAIASLCGGITALLHLGREAASPPS